MISFSQVLAIAPAIAITLLLNRHIRVEFILMRFPKRVREAINSFTLFFP